MIEKATHRVNTGLAGPCFFCSSLECHAAPEDSIDHIEIARIKIAKNVNLMQIFITCNPKPVTMIGNIVPRLLMNKITLTTNEIHEARVEKIAKQTLFFDFLHARFDSPSDPKV